MLTRPDNKIQVKKVVKDGAEKQDSTSKQDFGVEEGQTLSPNKGTSRKIISFPCLLGLRKMSTGSALVVNRDLIFLPTFVNLKFSFSFLG